MNQDRRLKTLNYLKVTFKEILNSYSFAMTMYKNEQTKLKDTAH